MQVLGDRGVSLIFHYPKRLTIKKQIMYKEMRVDQNLNDFFFFMHDLLIIFR